MGRLLAILGAAVLFIGGLFASRTASATPQVIDPDKPEFDPPSGTRGIVNNNPMNIEFRTSIQWRGQLGTDGRFAVFDTAINGIRAGMINVHTKMTRDGLNSVRKIINRLSPSFENPTESFITFVSGRMGVSPDQPLVFKQHIIPMSRAIVTFENGRDPYSLITYATALAATGR